MVRVHEVGEILRVDTSFGSFSFKPVGPVRLDQLRALADTLNEAVAWQNEADAPREPTPSESLILIAAK